MKTPRGAIALLAFAAAGCGARAAAPADPHVPTVSVVRVERGDVTRTITLPGDLAGRYEAALHAKVTGYLRRIDVDKGDWVKAGQVLAEIEVPELEQKLKRARAELEVRRVTHERLAGVWKSDHRLVAREDVDVALGKFEEAQAEVEELEALVGYTKIVAPFDGVVTGRFVDPGALVLADGHGGAGGGSGEGRGSATGVPIVTLADIGTLRVYVHVPEEETRFVRRGMRAVVRPRGQAGRTFTGTVARFATALDLATRTMLTEIDIDNAAHELYPGMYADVNLELERHAGSVTVPDSAVGADGDGRYVYVVRDLHLAKVPVHTGFANESRLELTDGLAGDEQVVRSVSPALHDGEAVRPEVAGAAQPASGAAG